MLGVRILYINGGVMDFGGISSYMMNYYRYMVDMGVQIDFVVHGNQNGRYDDEIAKLGGKIYNLPTKRENFIKWKKMLVQIFESGKYKIVHAHADTMNGYILSIAKRCGVPVRISHSHNTEHLTNNPIKKIVHNYFGHKIIKSATHLWACSEMAGRWLYKDHAFEVIHNAVDIDKFRYSKRTGWECRNKFNMGKNTLVIGNIAKFEYQKNHKFLIEVFNEVLKAQYNAIMVLVGAGSNLNQIKEQAKEAGIFNNIIFMGNRTDVDKIYNMFDVYVMTSYFEGLPVTAMEAQANGLPCILSDTITREANITDNCEFLPLNNPALWAKTINKHHVRRSKDEVEQLFRKKGYDLRTEAIKLGNKYLELQGEKV